jgi:N utilization substance protein A
MRAIDVKELISAMEELEKERGIDKDYLVESLQTALANAYKRNFDQAENIRVEVEQETGQIKIYNVKEIVEEVEDEKKQISLKDAKKQNKKAEIGETLETEVIPDDFGRIAAQTARQVIVQKIREAERNIVFTEYNDRKGEIVSRNSSKVKWWNTCIRFRKIGRNYACQRSNSYREL